MSKPKIVIFDLETLADYEEVKKVFFQLSNYPGLTMKATHNTIISFGYKILGEKQAHCKNAWDFPKSWKRNVNDDKAICQFAYDILHDADAVITHNGIRFDWKFLQSRLLINKLPVLPKIAHIDTCNVAKSNLFFFNNRLNTLARALTAETKLENGGQDLWTRVAERDTKACKLMSDYCKQDVVTLEAVFEVLKPFIKNLPNRNLFDGTGESCPTCGSHKLQKRGFILSKAKRTQRFQCQDCGSWSKETGKNVVGA
jgi:uncharacterized protein YprB with RNaseH-like and TPR domain